MRTQTRRINVNGETFDLTIIFRQQKSFSLAITDPYKLRLSLPLLQTEASALRFIDSRKDWITRKNNEIRFKRETTFLYHGGEEIWFLGRKYQFLVMNGDDNIVISDDTICFYTRKRTEDTILSAFYAACQPYLQAVCDEYRQELLDYIRSGGYYRIPTIEYKVYKRRWGVCYPSKNLIVLNLYLIHFPPNCIYYVYLHEMVHFLHPDHSREFHAAVKKKLPDYKRIAMLMH